MERFSYEDISKFLPRYLSDDSTENLRKWLEQFTKRAISCSIYTNRLIQEKTIFQGDALEGMLIVKLPETKIQAAKAIILSNTCDLEIYKGWCGLQCHDDEQAAVIIIADIIGYLWYRSILSSSSDHVGDIALPATSPQRGSPRTYQKTTIV